MRTPANNFATHRTIRDMHCIRWWTRNSGWKGFSPSLPLLIAFHSTDKEVALNIKVILFLLFFAWSRERNFRSKKIIIPLIPNSRLISNNCFIRAFTSRVLYIFIAWFEKRNGRETVFFFFLTTNINFNYLHNLMLRSYNSFKRSKLKFIYTSILRMYAYVEFHSVVHTSKMKLGWPICITVEI